MNREEWLSAFTDGIQPYLAACGVPGVPRSKSGPIKFSVSYPRPRHKFHDLAEYIPGSVTTHGDPEVHVSPGDFPGLSIAASVVHSLLHVACADETHSPTFRRYESAVGLSEYTPAHPMVIPGLKLEAAIRSVLGGLPDWTSVSQGINTATASVAPTRSTKLSCAKCNWVVRVTSATNLDHTYHSCTVASTDTVSSPNGKGGLDATLLPLIAKKCYDCGYVVYVETGYNGEFRDMMLHTCPVQKQPPPPPGQGGVAPPPPPALEDLNPPPPPQGGQAADGGDSDDDGDGDRPDDSPSDDNDSGDDDSGDDDEEDSPSQQGGNAQGAYSNPVSDQMKLALQRIKAMQHKKEDCTLGTSCPFCNR